MTGGAVGRREPNGAKYFEAHPECKKLFQKVGWLTFCESLQGYNDKATKAFAESFDGTKAQVGNLALTVSEDSVAVATGLQKTGERWFKGMRIKRQNLNEYLLPDHQNPDWGKGIPRAWVKEEWHEVLEAVQKFITCEGRYAITFLYHMRFLLHFQRKEKINLPFFLWRSLAKMAQRVQTDSVNPERSIFHHGLVRLLILDELKKQARTWNHSLFWSGFQENFTAENLESLGAEKSPQNIKSSPAKRRKRIPVGAPVEEETDTTQKKKQKGKIAGVEKASFKRTSPVVLHATRSRSTRNRAKQAPQELEQEQEEDNVIIAKSILRRPRTGFSEKNRLPSPSNPIDSNLEESEIPTVCISPISKLNTVELPEDYEPDLEPEDFKPAFDNLEPEDFKPIKQAAHSEKSTAMNTGNRSKLKKKNKKIQRLRDEIQELEFLDRHIKQENETLKAHSAKMNAKNKRLQSKCKTVFRKAREWYKQAVLLKKYNGRLRYRLIHKRRQNHQAKAVSTLNNHQNNQAKALSTLNIDILIQAAERV